MQVYNIPTGAIGTNTYLVYNEATMQGFLVDPGEYSKGIADKIKEMGIDIKYIILTHGHADHIMGVPGFKSDFPNAEIIAHVKEKEMLSDTNFNMSTQFGRPTVVEADRYVDDEEEMDAGGLHLRFLFTPGHSPGGMCIYINDLEEAIHTKLWPLPDDTQVFPGHMGPTNIGFEKEHNPFV